MIDDTASASRKLVTCQYRFGECMYAGATDLVSTMARGSCHRHH